ncbi:MAG: hypothetical protein AMJ54_05515 [Deltaproteobacteria bacterium SG8_13]|nr:MAG: hypothetical protein AMJ54_05515 [Deltaproteobacteria bacterium SG8_13]
MLGVYPPVEGHAAEKYQHLVNCDLHQGTCSQRLQETDILLEVTPRPVKAMTDLLFRVTLVGKFASPESAPYIDLGMPGMNMGPNRVLLKSSGPSSYEGQGVIVRCPSGRKIWQATVTLPDLGVVSFVFHVIY